MTNAAAWGEGGGIQFNNIHNIDNGLNIVFNQKVNENIVFNYNDIKILL